MKNTERRSKKRSNPSGLLEEAKALSKVKSNRAFAELIEVPYSTVQNWSEGKGSVVALRLLEMHIKYHKLIEENNAFKLILKRCEEIE